MGDPQWQSSIWYSLEIGVVACVLATTAGFFAAYALVRGAFGGKKLLLSLLLLPIIVPTVITSIAMYFLSARLHLVGNLLWIGVCHAVIALPIVVLILLSTLQGVDINLERAALSPGCQPGPPVFARGGAARGAWADLRGVVRLSHIIRAEL